MKLQKLELHKNSIIYGIQFIDRWHCLIEYTDRCSIGRFYSSRPRCALCRISHLRLSRPGVRVTRLPSNSADSFGLRGNYADSFGLRGNYALSHDWWHLLSILYVGTTAKKYYT